MAVKGMIKDFVEKNSHRKTIAEHEVKRLLRDAGLSVPEGIFIRRDDPFPAAVKLAYPLVAKVSSGLIVSKSDSGGIRTGLRNYDELRAAAEELLRFEGAEGVLLEEMAPDGLEVILGGIMDKQFGPVIMFGLGGVFVEAFGDTAFAMAPVERDKALWLVRQIKGYRLLEGYRGRPASDMDALLDVVFCVSGIISTGLVEEIDLNPVRLYTKGAMVLDAKMKIIHE